MTEPPRELNFFNIPQIVMLTFGATVGRPLPPRLNDHDTVITASKV